MKKKGGEQTKGSTFSSLLKSELKGLWSAFWRPFWRATLLLAVLLWAYTLISGGVPEDASLLLYLLFGLLYCIYFCSFVGLIIFLFAL